VLDVLLPELSTYLYDRPPEDGTFWSLLSELDRWTEERGEPADDIVLWTCLLFEPLLEACASDSDASSAALDFLDPIVERLNVPRRVADAVRRIVSQLPRMYAGRPGRFSRTPLYAPACEVLALLGEGHPKLDAFLDTTPKKKRRRKRTAS
jgi:poly(A) polymerase